MLQQLPDATVALTKPTIQWYALAAACHSTFKEHVHQPLLAARWLVATTALYLMIIGFRNSSINQALALFAKNRL